MILNVFKHSVKCCHCKLLRCLLLALVLQSWVLCISFEARELVRNSSWVPCASFASDLRPIVIKPRHGFLAKNYYIWEIGGQCTMNLNIQYKVRRAFLCDCVRLLQRVCHFSSLLSARVYRSRCEQLLHFFVVFAWRDQRRGTVSKHRGILAPSPHWASWDMLRRCFRFFPFQNMKDI